MKAAVNRAALGASTAGAVRACDDLRLPCPDTDQLPDGCESVLANQSCASDEGASLGSIRLGGIQSVSGWQAFVMAAPGHMDEQENADGDLVFVDKAQQQVGGAVFDDRLVMLSPKVLIQQMVQAQRLP